MGGIFFEFFRSPVVVVLYVVCIVIALSVHEYAHAKMADMLGDPTPRLRGRLTLDPRAHLDLWGSILFLFAGFGWGKPVPFDLYNLKNPRQDAMKIAFAGPLSNIILALCASILLKVSLLLFPDISGLFGAIVEIFIRINVILAVFNLIPIEPLDGFKVVGGLLPADQAAKWYTLAPYGMIFLFVLIVPFGPGPSIISSYLQTVGGLLLSVLL